jgi:hypothetical protein
VKRESDVKINFREISREDLGLMKLVNKDDRYNTSVFTLILNKIRLIDQLLELISM